MIWEIHIEGRVLINKTPSNTDLLPKTTKYQHWSEYFFFLPIKKKKFQILHALFLLKIYLFSCRVLKKFCGYMLCNLFYFILWMLCLSKLCDIWEKIRIEYFSSNPPFSIQDFKSLWIEIWFFKFSMILGILVFVSSFTSLGLELGILVLVGQYKCWVFQQGLNSIKQFFMFGISSYPFLLPWFLTYSCEEHKTE